MKNQHILSSTADSNTKLLVFIYTLRHNEICSKEDYVSLHTNTWPGRHGLRLFGGKIWGGQHIFCISVSM